MACGCGHGDSCCGGGDQSQQPPAFNSGIGEYGNVVESRVPDMRKRPLRAIPGDLVTLNMEEGPRRRAVPMEPEWPLTRAGLGPEAYDRKVETVDVSGSEL